MNMQICPDCFKEYEIIEDVCPNCGYVLSSGKREVYYLPVGTVLRGKYIIGQVLSSGGYVNTYKAWDNVLERFIAVKEFYPSGLVNRIPGSKEIIISSQKYVEAYERGKAYFYDETRFTTGFINVPSIVNVYDYFEENNTIYIVSELLDCVTLSSYVVNSEYKRLEYKEACRIILQVAEALKALHEKKIIHRDVNPNNVLIFKDTDRTKAKLIINYGEIKFQGEDKASCTVTLGYTAPEQYMKKCDKQGSWTDVYSLGAIMYYLLTGKRPDDATTRVIKDEVVYPHVINETIPPKISKAIMKAMAVDRRKRYKKVEDFVKEIRL